MTRSIFLRLIAVSLFLVVAASNAVSLTGLPTVLNSNADVEGNEMISLFKAVSISNPASLPLLQDTLFPLSPHNLKEADMHLNGQVALAVEKGDFPDGRDLFSQLGKASAPAIIAALPSLANHLSRGDYASLSLFANEKLKTILDLSLKQEQLWWVLPSMITIPLVKLHAKNPSAIAQKLLCGLSLLLQKALPLLSNRDDEKEKDLV